MHIDRLVSTYKYMRDDLDLSLLADECINRMDGDCPACCGMEVGILRPSVPCSGCRGGGRLHLPAPRCEPNTPESGWIG